MTASTSAAKRALLPLPALAHCLTLARPWIITPSTFFVTSLTDLLLTYDSTLFATEASMLEGVNN